MSRQSRFNYCISILFLTFSSSVTILIHFIGVTSCVFRTYIFLHNRFSSFASKTLPHSAICTVLTQRKDCHCVIPQFILFFLRSKMTIASFFIFSYIFIFSHIFHHLIFSFHISFSYLPFFTLLRRDRQKLPSTLMPIVGVPIKCDNSGLFLCSHHILFFMFSFS